MSEIRFGLVWIASSRALDLSVDRLGAEVDWNVLRGAARPRRQADRDGGVAVVPVSFDVGVQGDASRRHHDAGAGTRWCRVPPQGGFLAETPTDHGARAVCARELELMGTGEARRHPDEVLAWWSAMVRRALERTWAPA